jgi:acetoin utilization protein AcuA
VPAIFNFSSLIIGIILCKISLHLPSDLNKNDFSVTDAIMSETISKEIIIHTPRGDIHIHSFCRPEQIQQYAFDRYFGVNDDFKSIITQRESLVKCAAGEGANVVLALADAKDIIGYGVLDYPDAGERWAELGPKIMMEIKAIEVCRTWRSVGVAHGIMEMLLAHPLIEDTIIYLVGYSWTWDLAGSVINTGQYSEKLADLFRSHGFQEYETNEPNVCLKPENFLMGRIGKNISQTIKDRFKWLRFGLTPWTWEVDKP